MLPKTLTLSAAGALGALALAAAGCSVNASYSVKITTGDGVDMEVPIAKRFEINASDDVMEVTNFKFMPVKRNDEGTMGFAVEIRFKGGARPTSITMDDDTEDPIVFVFTDASPKLVKGDRWQAATPGYNPADPRVNWVSTLDNGLRVYRFTATLADGKVDVLRLPIFVPGMAKEMFRTELGIK